PLPGPAGAAPPAGRVPLGALLLLRPADPEFGHRALPPPARERLGRAGTPPRRVLVPRGVLPRTHRAHRGAGGDPPGGGGRDPQCRGPHRGRGRRGARALPRLPPDRLRLVARGMGRPRRAPLRRRGGCHPCRAQGGLQAAIRPPLPVTAPTSTPPVWEDGHALRLPPLEG